MNQNEFNQFYDSLRGYANKRAIRLFSDVALKEEAVDVAMDGVIDELIGNKNIENKEAYCKIVIRHSLYKSATRWKIEAINLGDTPFNTWGWRGRKFK